MYMKRASRSFPAGAKTMFLPMCLCKATIMFSLIITKDAAS